MLRPLFVALRLLTRLPVPDPLAGGADGTSLMRRSLVWYPTVGALLGGLLWGLAFLLAAWPTPPLLTAGLLLLAWVALTGALHLDGLADMADAWLGGMGDRERTLAIMKDPCTGPAGVVALALVLLLKFAALASLDESPGAALLLAVIFGRVALALLFVTTPYVRPGGMGEGLAMPGDRRAVLGGGVVLVPALLLWPLPTVVAGGIAGSVFLYHRHRLLQRLGGTTGDTAGALVEWTETAVLIGLVLMPSVA